MRQFQKAPGVLSWLWLAFLYAGLNSLLLASSNSDPLQNGAVAPVHFGVERGYFDHPFVLYLSCPTRAAVIRFTTDGSEPTIAHGQVYSGPLTVSTTMVLRAAAFKSGYAPSGVATRSYFFDLPLSLRALPALSLVTDSNNLAGPTGILDVSGGTYVNDVWAPTTPADYHNPSQTGREWERPVSAEFILTNDNSGFQIDAGLRVHGSPFTRARYRADSKFSFRLYFRSDYGKGELEYPWFPGSSVDRFDVVVLRAGHNDTDPFIRDELTRQLHADMGHVATLGNFANLFINGAYRGYYNPVEHIDEHFLQHHHGGSEFWDVIGPDSEAQEGDLSQWHELLDLLAHQETLGPELYLEAARRLDLENFVDYLLLNVYAATWDWPHNNWHAARERTATGRFRFYVWDAEGAFGQGGHTPSFNSFTATESGLSGTSELAQLYQALRRSPEVRLLFADRIQLHFFNAGALTDSNILARAEQMRQILAGVLPHMDLSIQNWWVPQRRAALFDQFAEEGLLARVPAPQPGLPPGRVPLGSQVSFNNSAGAVYFTTDGSDPRTLLTGTIAPTAQLYAQPFALDRSVHIKARTRVGEEWSALVEIPYAVEVPEFPVRITEINYHPPDDSPCEFLELQNVTDQPVNLSGFFFHGIDFRFQEGTVLGPNAIFLLASAAAQTEFPIRYPGVEVNGWFGGSLANNGETITLFEPNGVAMLVLNYGDDDPWPTSPDGAGATLELVSVRTDPNNPASWRASVDGSPGRPNPSGPDPYIGPFFNEIMANARSAAGSDGTVRGNWFELYNPSAGELDLSGRRLGHEGPESWTFPPQTTMPADSYLVVLCDPDRLPSTQAEPILNCGLALRKNGDRLRLYDLYGNLAAELSYGWQVPDQSIGDASGQWTLLSSPTPGDANSEAASLFPASRLRINEWMARPIHGPDWFELYNPLTQPVNLSGLFLTDDPSPSARRKFEVPPLSFIAGHGWVDWDCVGAPGGVGFELNAGGETLSLYDNDLQLIDSVSFGNQTPGLSQGRLPDGHEQIETLEPSPGQANFQVPLGLRIEEIAPGSGWIKLFNDLDQPVALRDWLASNDRTYLLKTRVNIVVPPHRYALLTSALLGFDLDEESGGEFFLSESANGQLTGRRLVASYPAVPPGWSAVWWKSAEGQTYVLSSQPSPEGPNAPPALGPIIIDEVMYHPPGLESQFEFVELANLTDQPVPLNGWRLRGGIRYDFENDITLAGNSRLVMVGFDPIAEPGLAAGFRTAYGLPASADLLGPFLGRLDNAEDTVSLVAPFVYSAGRTIAVITEQIHYHDVRPWPDGAVDGGAWSLQRRPNSVPAVDALAWMGGPPTPGAPNASGSMLPDILGVSGGGLFEPGADLSLEVRVIGDAPIFFQWRLNQRAIPGAVLPTLLLDELRLDDDGAYDVVVSGMAGSVISDPVAVRVALPPSIVNFSSSAILRGGDNITLSVEALGSPPLSYSWYQNARRIRGADGPMLVLNNLLADDAGRYTVVVSNRFGIVTSPKAVLRVLVPPSVTAPPQDQRVVAGGTAILSISAEGTLPIGYRWMRGRVTVAHQLLFSHTAFLVLSNVQPAEADRYSVILTNDVLARPGVISAPAVLSVEVDTDQDGLPDGWEINHGGDPGDPSDARLDSDGDGATNAEEYLAGTDPNDPTSFLRLAASLSEAGVQIEFIAQAGHSYTVEYTDGLSPGLWQKLNDVAAPAETGPITVLDLDPSGTRFYRLVTPASP